MKEKLKGFAWGVLGLFVFMIAALIVIGIIVGPSEDAKVSKVSKEISQEVVEERESTEELNLKELMLKEGLTVEEWRSALNRSTSEEVGSSFDELAIEGLKPAESWLLEEWSRHEHLNREWSYNIEVDDSMSVDILDALYFYEKYLNRVSREEVKLDVLDDWCFSIQPVMLNYLSAMDQEKAPMIRGSLETIKEELYNCIDDVKYPATYIIYYYQWFEGFEDWTMALYQFGLM